jgi:hypothetical protein
MPTGYEDLPTVKPASAYDDLPEAFHVAPNDPPLTQPGILGQITDVANLPGQWLGRNLTTGKEMLSPEEAEKSVIGISPEDIPSGANTTAPAITIPLSSGAKAVAGIGQYLTSRHGLSELAAAPVTGGMMGVKWLLDMVHGITEQVPAAKEAYQKGDTQGVSDALANAGAMALGVAMGARELRKGMKPNAERPTTAPEAPEGSQTPYSDLPDAPAATGAQPEPAALEALPPNLAQELASELTKRQIAKPEMRPQAPAATSQAEVLPQETSTGAPTEIEVRTAKGPRLASVRGETNETGQTRIKSIKVRDPKTGIYERLYAPEGKWFGTWEEAQKAGLELIRQSFPESSKPKQIEAPPTTPYADLPAAEPSAKPAENIPKNIPKVPVGEIPTVDQLLAMSPDELVNWKRATKYGPDTPGKIAATLTPEDAAKLAKRSAELREQANGMLGGAQNTSLNSAILREIGEDFERLKKEVPTAEPEAVTESVKPENHEVETDPTKIQEIKNSIREGEMILETGEFHGRKRSPEYLEAVRKSVENSKARIPAESQPALTPEEQAAEQRALAESQPTEVPKTNEEVKADLESKLAAKEQVAGVPDSGSSDQALHDSISKAFSGVMDKLKGEGWTFDPQWGPLELVLPKEELDQWMFMGKHPNPYAPGKSLFEYKNGITRRYLRLDDEGISYGYKGEYEGSDNRQRYPMIPLEEAVKRAYEGIEEMGHTRTTKYNREFIEARNKALLKAGFGVSRATPEGTLTSMPNPIEHRGARGGNLSTFGMFDPANYATLKDVPDEVKLAVKWGADQWTKVMNRVARSKPYDYVAKTKDAADNISNVLAKQTGNGVLHELNRAFGIPKAKVKDARNLLRENALTFVIEADGERNELGRMRYALTNADASAIHAIWKRRALTAIDFAEQNWERLQPVAQLYKRITDAQRAYEAAHGLRATVVRGGYVYHAQDVDASFGNLRAGATGQGGGAPQPFNHIRDHATYADAIANGIVPESLNSIDLLQRRVALGQRLVKYGEWIDALSDLADPKTETPVVTQPMERARADGSADITAPEGYGLYDFGGRQVALHNGYAGLMGDLTNPSWMQGTEFRKNVMQLAGVAKHTALLFDSYHLGRLAVWNAVTRVGAPRYERGLTLLDNTTGKIQRMVERGEVPRDWGQGLLESKRKLQLMLKEGMNVGNIGDNLYTDFLSKLPALGDFNKWLFEKYQRGAMSEVGLIEFGRQRKMFPSETDAQIARARGQRCEYALWQPAKPVLDQKPNRTRLGAAHLSRAAME